MSIKIGGEKLFGRCSPCRRCDSNVTQGTPKLLNKSDRGGVIVVFGDELSLEVDKISISVENE